MLIKTFIVLCAFPFLIGGNANDENSAFNQSEEFHATTITTNSNKIMPVGIQIISGIFEGESNGWVSCLAVSGYCMIIVSDKVPPQYDIPENDLPAIVINENSVERILPNKKIGRIIEDTSSKRYELLNAY